MRRDQTTTDEIAQIERELEILRSRQASLARWYRVTMIYLAITFPVIAALIAAILYTWNIDIVAIIYRWSSDIVVVAFIVGMTAIVAGLIWIIGRPSSLQPDQQQLSDQQQPSQFFPSGLGVFRPSGPNYKSDAETIHDMIVLRKLKTGRTERRGSPVSAVGFRLGRNRKNEAQTVQKVIVLIESTT
jgi:hypothetical protein